MKTRIIHTRFWQDSFVCQLSHKEKLLFIYLITNDRVNIIGCYELPDKYIMADLDLTRQELEKAKQKLHKAGKVLFKDGWIRIVNADKYNSYNGEKLIKAKENELSQSPKELIEYKVSIDTSIDTSMNTSIDTPNNHKSIIYNNNNNNNKTYKVKIDNGEKEFTLEEIAKRLLNLFNEVNKTKYSNIKVFISNLEKTLEIYTPIDIAKAIEHIPLGFWKDKMKPEILFRQKNPQGEPVDYIGQLLNSKQKYE